MTQNSQRWAEETAQLWCEPQHSKKEMDVEFAKSIQALCARVEKETLFEVKKRLEARIDAQCSEATDCDSHEHGYECLRNWEGANIVWEYMRELGLLPRHKESQ